MNRILYSLSGASGEHYSPHVWKIIMALKHKGLDFTLNPVSFEDISGIEDGSFTSVPVLNDGGTLLNDSFEIARHLEEKYLDAPSLFDGAGGIALSRFVESYCKTVLHPSLAVIAVMDMHNLMSDADRTYFRAAREKRFGQTLEDVYANRGVELAALPQKLAPIRDLLSGQNWLGSNKPLYADYILFGTLQWCRVCCGAPLLEPTDPVRVWFERCLDLHDGMGRTAIAA
ncbi:glutathione S-transferase family protein [Pseudovibrio sp. Tun.PSC04-5.I4]|uniref:glutathione S-transferase family protein n=1 Tax=Pseudovibrio sp. Tun.PSC04-5.I4 TaxID=1798213 RepID=UPI0008848192|nr:glutathione S-transferase family protein [Pseudovibrio sp. Tun.PSC04-5.I4]SDQ33815.1 Glutathione S-transferase [Pseudovibrio sp. Tun.PSC04-5.I4]